MRRCVLAVCLLLPLAAVARAAEKIEPIDTEFLEYLAELEGADEDWTLFEAQEVKATTEAAKVPDKAPARASGKDERKTQTAKDADASEQTQGVNR